MTSAQIAIQQFNNLWPGGYLEGDPLDPMAGSSYGVFGYVSVLHATYLACIKPYVGDHTTVIEIGPGRGAWTKTFVHLGARKIYALDAVSPERAQFWEYVGQHTNVEYITVKDFSLSEIPDNAFDYFFSYGVFCHIEPEHAKEYLRNLPRKLRAGARGFLMVGDFDKYNAFCASSERYNALNLIRGLTSRRFAPLRWAYRMARTIAQPSFSSEPLDKYGRGNLANSEGLGEWHHFSTDDACRFLEDVGLTIVEPDVGVNPRDPVIHFLKK